MIRRIQYLKEIPKFISRYPVTALLGARQVGKTTLARQITRSNKIFHWFDLENPEDLAKLQEPIAALKRLKGLVVLDEIQRLPEIFPSLRVLADEPGHARRFLILGSASTSLLRQSSESLAGRISYRMIDGFNPAETGLSHLEKLWLRGGFPLSYLAPTEADSFQWRKDFVQTFLERDIPQFQISVPAATLRRFWAMLAHYHGQVWNSSEFARSFGVADTTVRRYLDLLSDTFMIRQLQPWFENIGKRQVKSPKIYFRDSGLFHTLAGIKNVRELMNHPKAGASWEGFVIQSVIGHLKAENDECYFWSTHTGAELDLLIVRGGTRLGFEVKRAKAPVMTPSMRNAVKDLKLEKLVVIHPGQDNYPMGERVEAVAFHSFLKPVKNGKPTRHFSR